MASINLRSKDGGGGDSSRSPIRSRMGFFTVEYDFDGTVISPSTEIISADVSTSRRRLTQGNSPIQWRTEVTPTAEDGGMLSVCRQPHQSPRVVRSDKKSLNKARSAGKTRSHSYGGDYRKLT